MILLYNSKGDYIAFKKDMYLFDVDGRWIGFFDEDEDICYDVKGRYLGTIIDNRLYKDITKIEMFSNKIVDFTGYPEMFEFPHQSRKKNYKDLKM